MKIKSFFTKKTGVSNKSSIDKKDNSDKAELIKIGKEKASKGAYKEALKLFDKVINLKPECNYTAEAYLERVQINLKLDRVEKIDEDMKASQIILDKMNEAWDAYQLAGEQYDNQEFIEAIKNYNKAITLRPTLTDVYYNRGISKYALKDYSGAIDDFTLAINKNASNKVDAYIQRSILKSKHLEDNEGAKKDLTSAIEENPDSSELYYHRSLLLDEYNSIQDLNKAIKLSSNGTKYYWVRGIKKYKLNDFNGGQNDLQQYIDLLPEDSKNDKAKAYSLMGSMCIDKKDYTEALTFLTKSINMGDSNSETYFERAFIQYNLGRYKDAISDLNTVISIDPENADSYYYRGKSKQALNQIDWQQDIDKAYKLGFNS